MRIKLSPDTVRRLVVLHTVLLAMILAVGLIVLVLAARNERVRGTIRAVINQEKQQSALLERLRDDDANGVALDRFGLEIAPKHMRRIQELSESLRDAQALTDEDKRWFPAALRVDGETYDGKVRLRGDLGSHWRGTKKSWRFRVKGERYPRGYREIDLIIPRDKGYEVEKVSYDVARELGLFAPDAGFVNVDLNGVDLGAYFWREPPGKEALERLRYPEGEIFAEQNTWIQEFFSGRGLYRLYSPPVSFFPANWEQDVHGGTPVAGYFAQRWNTFLSLVESPFGTPLEAPDENPGEPTDARFARELPTLLDVDKYLAWNALTWLFGSTHSHWGDNLSWYYDNTTGRFEPLLYDVFRYPIENRKLGTFEYAEHDELAQRVLRHPSFRQRRNALLWRLVNDDDFDLAARMARAGAPLVPHLARGVDAPGIDEVEAFQAETATILDANRRLIHDHLQFGRIFLAPELDVDGTVPTLRVRLVPDALANLHLESLTLRLAPSTSLDRDLDRDLDLDGARATLVDPSGGTSAVEVTSTMGLTTMETETGTIDVPEITLEWTTPIVLSTPVDEQLVPRRGTYTLVLSWPNADATVWRRAGTVTDVSVDVVHSLTTEALPDSHVYRASPAYAFTAKLPRVETLAQAFSAAEGTTGGLRWRRDGDVVVVPAGVHRLTDDLVLRPAGLTLRLEAGARLELGPGVSVLHRGPLDVRGTAAAPVEIVPADDARPWGGFGVIGAQTRSQVEHLRVRGGSEDWVDGVFLSGQLCFYSADVDLAFVSVLDARADDGLNVKRGDVHIRHSVFQGNAFDAFDGDWVTGLVEQSRFTHNDGDGIDVSGTTLLVRDSLFVGQGDKSLSIGERSQVTAVNVVLRDSVVGLAIKDLSQVRLVSSVLYGNQTAVTLYRKKPIFGGGTGLLVASLLWNNETNYTLDAESTLSLLGMGHDHFTAVSGITANDNRMAPVAPHYRIQGEAGFAFVGGGDSPFARGPKAPSDLDDLDLPALDAAPLGLLTPLDVP